MLNPATGELIGRAKTSGEVRTLRVIDDQLCCDTKGCIKHLAESLILFRLNVKLVEIRIFFKFLGCLLSQNPEFLFRFFT